MNDVSDLRHTIVPKSDQLNADQLLGGPMTLTVTGVKLVDGEQPVVISYENDNGRPYKPCKTMRKVLIYAWGQDGRQWVGRAMTLYNDATVKVGGTDVGGIRISHLSDIPKDVRVSLTATKGKKALYEIRSLPAADVGFAAAISRAETAEALKEAFAAAYKSTRAEDKRAAYKAAYDRRTAELARKSAPVDVPAIEARLRACTDREALAQLGDELRDIEDKGARDLLFAVWTECDARMAG